jgi:hypothetical protein
MYGFPEDLQLDDIIGSEIQQICLGPGDVQFRFGSGRHICVEGFAEVFNGEERVSAWDQKRNWTNVAFQALLMATIDGYAVLDARMLEIRFQNGLRLRLHDNSTQFESLQIYPELIIV